MDTPSHYVFACSYEFDIRRGSDIAPARDSLSHEAIPKGAARILNAARIQQDWKDKKRKRAEGAEDGPKDGKRQRVRGDDEGGQRGGRHGGGIKIQPGESLAHFNRRVPAVVAR